MAAVRGLTFSEDDRLRSEAIADLMCNMRYDSTRLSEKYGPVAETLQAEAEAALNEENPDWLIATPDGFRVTEEGRAFLRLIAARFDAYLPKGAGRHSSAM